MITAEPAQHQRGRPRTIGDQTCDRCGRATAKIRVTWPDGRICGICFHQATRTTGTCDGCNEHQVLPGREGTRRLCTTCAGITTPLTCTRCGAEGERYRQGICARCALRDDLTMLLQPSGQPAVAGTQTLINTLCSAARPESIHTWKRNPRVQQLLTDIGCCRTSLDHAGLDAAPGGKEREHLRQLLVHAGALPARDPDLALFQAWLTNRLDSTEPISVRLPLERFATWHLLPQIQRRIHDGHDAHGATHAAKQQITEVGRFLSWLDGRQQTIGDCTQADLDEWLTAGPSTRTAISTFIGWAADNKTTRRLVVPRRVARSSPLLDHDRRMHLLRTCLTGQPDTLAYRTAAILLLLYAQPLVRIVQIAAASVHLSPSGVTIRLGNEPTAVPEPFASLLLQHLSQRPNRQTVNSTGTPWLFPGGRAGRHLAANTVSIRLRSLGINLLGARNAALRELAQQAPAPIVAAQLGLSTQITTKHAALAGQPNGHYAALVRHSTPTIEDATP